MGELMAWLLRPPFPAPRHRVSALLFLTVAIGRWLFAADRRTFHLVPDELAIAGMARWFSGAADWNMLRANTWQPLHSVVLAPLCWLTDDPVTLYRLMIAAGALIGGLGAVQLMFALRRLAGLGAAESAALAGTASLLPPALSASAHVWAEPLVSIIFVAAVVGASNALGDIRARRWYPVIGLCALGYTAHGRLLPMLPLVVVLALVWAIRNGRWGHAGAYVATGALAYWVANAFSRWVIDTVWTEPLDLNTSGETIVRIGKIGPIADALGGQVWYLLVSSGMVAAFGFTALTRAALRKPTGLALEPHAARTLLLLMTSLIGTSVLFMADRARPDQLVYGRYNDAVMPLALAIGAAWALRQFQAGERRLVLLVSGIAGTLSVELAFLIRQLHGEQLDRGQAVKPMIAGIAPAMVHTEDIQLVLVTSIGVSIGAVTVAVLWWWRTSPRRLAIAIGVTVAALGVATERSFSSERNRLATAQDVTEVEPLLRGQADVGAVVIPSFANPSLDPSLQVSYALAYQWNLPAARFELDGGLDDAVGPYVFAVVDDPVLRDGGGTIVWLDEQRRMALWREPQIVIDP